MTDMTISEWIGFPARLVLGGLLLLVASPLVAIHFIIAPVEFQGKNFVKRGAKFLLHGIDC
jgi:hypothetical protein